MKVLIYKSNEISPSLGGISRINYNLKKALQSLGIEVVYLSSKRLPNIKPDRIQRWLPDTATENTKDNLVFLHQLIVDESIGVIINNNFSITSICFLDAARQGTNAKIISWIHNNFVEYASKVGYRHEKLLTKKGLTTVYKLITSKLSLKILRSFAAKKHRKTAKSLYDHSDRVVTVCKGNVGEFTFMLGSPDTQNKIVPISNFIPSLTDKTKTPKKENIVVWCGTIDFELKKTNWMLDIWKMIEKKEPDWTLYILGDSTVLGQMVDYAKMIGIQHVLFTGRVNPQEYYGRASILCSTSISESFGLTIVEGMQQGVVPIAFASSPAIIDIVNDNGVLVKPFDKNQFADGLLDIMLNKDKRTMLAQKCLSVSRCYEAESVSLQWNNLFIDLLNN